MIFLSGPWILLHGVRVIQCVFRSRYFCSSGVFQMLPVSSHCPEVICYLDCKYKVWKGGKNLRPQFGLLLGTLGSWNYCVEAGSLWNYELGSHSCCVNSYAPIHLLPPKASIFFFFLTVSFLGCHHAKGFRDGSLRRWGRSCWEEIPRCPQVYQCSITCSSLGLGSLDLGGYFLSVLSWFRCFSASFFSVSLAQQWWNQGGVGNQTGRARQLSPKPTPPLMEAMSHVPTPIPDRDLTTFYLSPGIPFQFYLFFWGSINLTVLLLRQLRGKGSAAMLMWHLFRNEQLTHQWLSESIGLLQDTLGPLGDSGSFLLLILVCFLLILKVF